MKPASSAPQGEQSVTVQQAATEPICPACGGPLLLLAGFARCMRCGFTMCEACAGEVEQPS